MKIHEPKYMAAQERKAASAIRDKRVIPPTCRGFARITGTLHLPGLAARLRTG